MWSFYLMFGYIGPLPSRGRRYYCTFVMHLDKKISDVFISKCKIAELTFIPHIIPNSVEPFKSSLILSFVINPAFCNNLTKYHI